MKDRSFIKILVLALVAAVPGSALARKVGTANRDRRPASSVRNQIVDLTTRMPPAWSGPLALRTTEKLDPETLKYGQVRVTERPHKERWGAMVGSRAECFAALKRWGVRFRGAKPHRGIRTPLELMGPIGGVHIIFRWKHTRAPLMDCNLMLTLARASPVMRRLGIRKVYYSSAYRQPSKGDKNPSRHGMGLAIDVSYVVTDDGTKHDVFTHWEKYYGGPGNCVGNVRTAKGLLLRRLICELEKRAVFKLIMTPDSDYAHRNHFHMASGMPGERWKRNSWAGRTLYQPLPGTPLFPAWYRWYRCYKAGGWKARLACFKQRRPSWAASGHPWRFVPKVRLHYLAGIKIPKPRKTKRRARRQRMRNTSSRPGPAPDRQTGPPPAARPGPAPALTPAPGRTPAARSGSAPTTGHIPVPGQGLGSSPVPGLTPPPVRADDRTS